MAYGALVMLLINSIMSIVLSTQHSQMVRFLFLNYWIFASPVLTMREILSLPNRLGEKLDSNSYTQKVFWMYVWVVLEVF